MPKLDPNKILFDFKENPEKQLAKTTLKIYKARLNQIAELSKQRHEINDQHPVITTKEDILKNPSYVVNIIESYSEDKKKRAAFFASVFYSTGRLDIQKDPSLTPLVKGFQTNYYTEAYKKKLAEQGKLTNLYE